MDCVCLRHRHFGELFCGQFGVGYDQPLLAEQFYVALSFKYGVREFICSRLGGRDHSRRDVTRSRKVSTLSRAASGPRD